MPGEGGELGPEQVLAGWCGPATASCPGPSPAGALSQTTDKLCFQFCLSWSEFLGPGVGPAAGRLEDRRGLSKAWRGRRAFPARFALGKASPAIQQGRNQLAVPGAF